MMDKIKVKFVRPVKPYRAGDTGYLNARQVQALKGMVEVVEEKKPTKKKAVKKAKNKSMQGSTKAKNK